MLDERFILVHNYGKIGAYAVISFSGSGTGMDSNFVRAVACDIA